jgi:hypothetical protein
MFVQNKLDRLEKNNARLLQTSQRAHIIDISKYTAIAMLLGPPTQNVNHDTRFRA